MPIYPGAHRSWLRSPHGESGLASRRHLLMPHRPDASPSGSTLGGAGTLTDDLAVELEGAFGLAHPLEVPGGLEPGLRLPGGELLSFGPVVLIGLVACGEGVSGPVLLIVLVAFGGGVSGQR